MIAKKQLWLLAGGNGSGKSTFYRMFIETRGIRFINADLIARDMTEEPEHVNYKAARLAERLCHDLLSQGLTFCFETVFSHASKIDFIAKAKSLGYEVILIYIHLGNPDLKKPGSTSASVKAATTCPPKKSARAYHEPWPISHAHSPWSIRFVSWTIPYGTTRSGK